MAEAAEPAEVAVDEEVEVPAVVVVDAAELPPGEADDPADPEELLPEVVEGTVAAVEDGWLADDPDVEDLLLEQADRASNPATASAELRKAKDTGGFLLERLL